MVTLLSAAGGGTDSALLHSWLDLCRSWRRVNISMLVGDASRGGVPGDERGGKSEPEVDVN